MQNPIVSVVIPCYNEEGSLEKLYSLIREQFNTLGIVTEIIFIDDGSTDTSRDIIRQLAANDQLCKAVFFRKNSGKAAGLDTGFKIARGHFIITMDADLQDDPTEIPRFLEALKTADVVSGWKEKRLDPIGKTFPSKIFNWTVRHFTNSKLHDMNCGFKGYRAEVLKEVVLYGELHRYVPALAAARGFKVVELSVTHHPRTTGVSKYGWERFLRGFFDLVTVVFITKYRNRPLHFFGNFAITFFVIGLIFTIFWGSLAAVQGHLITTGTIEGIKIAQAYVCSNIFLNLSIGSMLLAPVIFGLGIIAEQQLFYSYRKGQQPPVEETLNITEEN